MNFDFNSLTSKQKKVYSVIEAFIREKGIPPTVREIGELAGEKTPGAVQGILNRLEKKGVIKREVGMARSIQLATNDSHYLKPTFVPEVKKVSKRTLNDLLSVYNVLHYHPLSPSILRKYDNCILVDYKNCILPESNHQEDIMLLVCRDAEISEGDTVLAVYENHALLRKYYPADVPGYIKLVADLDLLGKDIFSTDEVSIVGKLVGMIMKY